MLVSLLAAGATKGFPSRWRQNHFSCHCHFRDCFFPGASECCPHCVQVQLKFYLKKKTKKKFKCIQILKLSTVQWQLTFTSKAVHVHLKCLHLFFRCLKIVHIFRQKTVKFQVHLKTVHPFQVHLKLSLSVQTKNAVKFQVHLKFLHPFSQVHLKVVHVFIQKKICESSGSPEKLPPFPGALENCPHFLNMFLETIKFQVHLKFLHFFFRCTIKFLVKT